jgi:predicted outer membrane protein
MKARAADARTALRLFLFLAAPRGPLATAAVLLEVASCGAPAPNIQPRAPSTTATTTSAPAAAPALATSSEPGGDARDLAPSRALIDQVANAAGGAVPMVSPAPIPPMSAARQSDATFTDAEIVAVLDAANGAEERIAREAIARAVGPRVRALARQALLDRTSASLERIARSGAIAPRESPTSVEIRASGARVAAGIESAGVQDFDRACVEALAGEEWRLVRLLDDALIPQSRDGELRTLLEDLRARVSSRLEAAEDLYPIARGGVR